MLKTRVIPCMLYNGSHIIKTIKFKNARTLGNPTQFARVYNSRNVDELIFIDILATKEKRDPDYKLIKDISKECFMPVAIGGGIKNLSQVKKLIGIGADKIIINHAAINDPGFIVKISEKFGSQALIVSMDAKRIGNEHYVFGENGTKNSKIKVSDWAKKVEKLGAGEIFLNSIDNDGVMKGYDITLIKKVTSAVSIPVIACGGAGNAKHIIKAITSGQADAVSLSSIFHYTENTNNLIKKTLKKSGINVRLTITDKF